MTVSVPPDATFYWGDGEGAYARSINHSENESEALGKTPEARVFMSALASQKIKGAFEREMAGRLSGTRPVRLDVKMEDVYVSSPLQQILIGGDYHMKASVALVDARTGEVIVAKPRSADRDPRAVGTAAIGDHVVAAAPFDRLALRLADSYRDWLFPAAEMAPRT